MIAALFVAEGGCYYGLDGVDPWGLSRDARFYAGPYPAICHPPCERWGKMWNGGIAWKGDPKKLGDDDGCFEAAIKAVRRYGGVLEHPKGSRAWGVDFFDLFTPPHLAAGSRQISKAVGRAKSIKGITDTRHRSRHGCTRSGVICRH